MTETQNAPIAMAATRIALGVATALVAINVWTGGPLLALWVGSQAVGSDSLSMGAVFLVVLVLAVVEIGLAVALGWLSAKNDALTGRPVAPRRTSPWLRSMRGEREEVSRQSRGISGVERIVVISVVACVIAFEVWFFFFAGSSLPSQ
jgi:heme A synthase